jgi:hypothetical protein
MFLKQMKIKVLIIQGKLSKFKQLKLRSTLKSLQILFLCSHLMNLAKELQIKEAPVMIHKKMKQKMWIVSLKTNILLTFHKMFHFSMNKKSSSQYICTLSLQISKVLFTKITKIIRHFKFIYREKIKKD